MSLLPSFSRHPGVAALFLFVLLSFFFSPALTFADAENDIRALFDQSEMPGDIEELLLELEQLRQRKIPINTATVEELLLIPFLSADDARRIVAFRETDGPFTSIEQLEGVIGTETARRVSLFLAFEPMLLEKRVEGKPQLAGRWYSRYFSEIPERKGILSGKYQGGNYKLYNRFSLGYEGIAVNGVMEKDIGEPEISDFNSFSLGYEGSGPVERFIVGNYTVNLGQGLLFGQSRYFSKGVDPLGVSLTGRRLKAYSSSAENGFMQGAAASLDFEPFTITAFYSNNHVDASVRDGVVTTIRTSGYHRTDSEREHKDNVREKVAGLNMLYRFDAGRAGGRFGGTWARYDYSMPLEKAGGEPGWHGMGSLEADILIGKVSLFAEAAMTGNENNVSWISGAGFPLTSGMQVLVAVRDYHNLFFSPFAGAFAERADNASNEEGYYVGLEADILNNLHVGAYYDIFRFPELSSRYRLPSTGDESKIFLTWKHSPFFSAELLLQNQYKEEAKRLFDATGLEYYMPVPFTSNRVRLDLIGKVTRGLTLKARGEIKFVEGEYPEGELHSDGWLFYQQAVLKKGHAVFKARYTQFGTDDFDSAIYVYEDDLPLVFTLKSYYGEGRAFFALLSYDLWKNFDLTVRYAKTWYSDRDTYSSGNDERETSAPASYHLGCALRF
jgi:hypothetical protein